MKQWMIAAIETMVLQIVPAAVKAAVNGIGMDGELYGRMNELEARVAKLERARAREAKTAVE